MIPSILQLDL